MGTNYLRMVLMAALVRPNLLRRLARDDQHKEIFDAYEAGEYPSVRAAAIAAGIVKPPTPFERVVKLWPTPDERQQVLDFAMSKKEDQALALRDLALIVVKAGNTNAATFDDGRIRIAYRAPSDNGPNTLDIERIGDGRAVKVLSVVWHDDGRAVVISHHGGSWEDYLKRLATG